MNKVEWAMIAALLAAMFYGGQIGFLDRGYRTYTPAATALHLYFGMTPCALVALIFLRLTNQPIDWPTVEALPFLWMIGGIIFLADYFTLKAFSLGGGSLAVGAIMLTIPLWSGGIEVWSKSEWPSPMLLVGILLIVVGVVVAGGALQKKVTTGSLETQVPSGVVQNR